MQYHILIICIMFKVLIQMVKAKLWGFFLVVLMTFILAAPREGHVHIIFIMHTCMEL